MIDRATVDKIRDTAQILDVVSEFVVLRRRGQNYVGLCPFHADKSPSFYVSPTKNICKCFSCNEGGDPVNFLMKHESMTYVEALRWLAKKYGIEIQERELSPEEIAAQTIRESMLNLNDFAAKTFENDLYNTAEGKNIGLAYFYERGLQDEVIKRYHLGYALDNKEDFARRAMEKSFARELLLDSSEENKNCVGLCYGDDPKRIPVCRFAGRVIFPFFSLSGKVVAFGGRILQRVDHAFKKYVNSPESMVYRKGDMLYGLFQAKQEIAKLNKCYIVEGNVDVLSMAQAGFYNTVASAGTALTSNQIRIIKRFTKNVVLMFDGDSAGINASIKSIDLLLREGMNVKLLLLPDGDDPDSFCRKYAATDVRNFFDANETDFITYKTQMLLREAANDPLKQSQVLQNIVQSIAQVSDQLMSSIYVRQTAQMLDIDERAVHEALRQARIAAPKQEEQPLVPKVTPVGTTGLITDSFERNIARQIVRKGGESFEITWVDEATKQTQSETWRVIDYIVYDFSQDAIALQHPAYARIYQLAMEATANPEEPFDSVKFFTRHEDMQVSQLALDLLDEKDDRYDALGFAPNNEDLAVLIPRCILEYKEAIVRMRINQTRAQLRAPGANHAEIMATLQQLQELKSSFDKALGERVVTG